MPEGCTIAVLHGDPAAPNADIFFKVPGGAEIPLHRHTSAERIVLVSGEMDVSYEGQDTVTLRTGDYAYGPPGVPHSASCAPGAPCILFIAFVDPVDALPVEVGE
jgi:quercetin dioxygenase-like cupin family protein